MLAMDAHVFSLPLSFPAGFACLSSSHIFTRVTISPESYHTQGSTPQLADSTKLQVLPPLSRALLPPNTASVTLQHDPRRYHQWTGKGEFQRFA